MNKFIILPIILISLFTACEDITSSSNKSDYTKSTLSGPGPEIIADDLSNQVQENLYRVISVDYNTTNLKLQFHTDSIVNSEEDINWLEIQVYDTTQIVSVKSTFATNTNFPTFKETWGIDADSRFNYLDSICASCISSSAIRFKNIVIPLDKDFAIEITFKDPINVVDRTLFNGSTLGKPVDPDYYTLFIMSVNTQISSILL